MQDMHDLHYYMLHDMQLLPKHGSNMCKECLLLRLTAALSSTVIGLHISDLRLCNLGGMVDVQGRPSSSAAP